MFLITLHDSILSTPDNVPRIEQAFHDAFERTGFPMSLKITVSKEVAFAHTWGGSGCRGCRFPELPLVGGVVGGMLRKPKPPRRSDRRKPATQQIHLADKTPQQCPFLTKPGRRYHAMDCINLKKRFGDRFRVTYEESYAAQHGASARVDDPWLQILMCQHGHLYPQGGDMLAASTDRRGPVAKALADMDCTTVLQDGDDGINVSFHVDDFEEVAGLMKPRRRRQVSDPERNRLAEMGRVSLKRYRKVNVEAPQNEPGSLPSGRSDSTAA